MYIYYILLMTKLIVYSVKEDNMNKTTRRKICKLFKNWFGYKLEQNGKCTKICDMLQELPLLEIFEYEEGFSVMTEKEYE